MHLSKVDTLTQPRFPNCNINPPNQPMWHAFQVFSCFLLHVPSLHTCTQGLLVLVLLLLTLSCALLLLCCLSSAAALSQQPEQITHQGGSTNGYCKYNDQILQLFTSSLFLAGAFAALVGMVTCKKLGRRFTMICGGAAFIIGKSEPCCRCCCCCLLLTT